MLNLKNEKVFVKILKIFDQHDKHGKQRVLYGPHQIPIYFWKYLTNKLIAIDMIQSNIYPCLFIGEK